MPSISFYLKNGTSIKSKLYISEHYALNLNAQTIRIYISGLLSLGLQLYIFFKILIGIDFQ